MIYASLLRYTEPAAAAAGTLQVLPGILHAAAPIDTACSSSTNTFLGLWLSCELLSVAQTIHCSSPYNCMWSSGLPYPQGFQPKRSLEVMMFTSEEPTRFKLSCVGSRAMAGALTADVLDVKLDENGTSFREV